MNLFYSTITQSHGNGLHLLTDLWGFDSCNSNYSVGSQVHNVTCNFKTSLCRCSETAEVCDFNLEINNLHTFVRYEIMEGSEQRFQIGGNLLYFDDKGELKSHPDSLPDDCMGLPENDTSCTSAFTVDGATY